MGVEAKIGGKPQKWMVYNGKLIKMDDLGVTPIFGNTQMSKSLLYMVV